jgi:hypothetical protein
MSDDHGGFTRWRHVVMAGTHLQVPSDPLLLTALLVCAGLRRTPPLSGIDPSSARPASRPRHKRAAG